MLALNTSFFLRLIIIALAVAPAFALGDDNRNLFLIGVMLLSPIIILTSKSFRTPDLLLIFFMLSIVFIPWMYQPESMRWSTVMYSIMFCLTFIAYNRLLYKDVFSIENYQKLLKYLIYAYFIMLLIQQFSVLLGLPVLNISNHDMSDPWKLNSLAAEPSHSARIVALLMFSYIVIKELTLERKYSFNLDFKNDRMVWIAFLWTMLTMGSATAIVFIIIILLKFIHYRTLIPYLVLGTIGLYVLITLGNESINRSLDFFLAVLTFDIQNMMTVDHSASMRIAPMIVIADKIDFSSLNGWFGYGIDYTSNLISKKIHGIPEGATGGALLQLLIEYGFVSFILFVVFSIFNTYDKKNKLTLVLWFMLIFLAGVNNQIVWLAIVLLFTNNYFSEIKGKLNEN